MSNSHSAKESQLYQIPNDPKCDVTSKKYLVNMHQLRVTDTVPIMLQNWIEELSRVIGAAKGFNTFLW